MEKKTNGLGIAGMVIGIIALVTLCCGGLGGFLGIIGIIFSIIAVCFKNKNKGAAIAGIVCNSISIFIMIIMLFAFESSDSDNEQTEIYEDSEFTIEKESEFEIETESKEDFINSCQVYSYKDLARNPDDYIGSRIVLEVKIEQIMQGGFFDNNEYYRVYTNDEYDFWMGDEYFMNDFRVDDNTKLLQDDIIRVYGEFAGTQEVTRAISGTKEYVPSINAYYIDLLAE